MDSASGDVVVGGGRRGEVVGVGERFVLTLLLLSWWWCLTAGGVVMRWTS